MEMLYVLVIVGAESCFAPKEALELWELLSSLGRYYLLNECLTFGLRRYGYIHVSYD